MTSKMGGIIFVFRRNVQKTSPFDSMSLGYNSNKFAFSLTLSPCSTLEKKRSRFRALNGPWVGYVLSTCRLVSAVKCSKKNPRMACTRLSQSWAPFSTFADPVSFCKIYRDSRFPCVYETEMAFTLAFHAYRRNMTRHQRGFKNMSSATLESTGNRPQRLPKICSIEKWLFRCFQGQCFLFAVDL